MNDVEEESDVDMELLESDIDDKDDVMDESPEDMSKYANEERKVPHGWSMKGEGRSIVLTSPTGKIFKGR